MSRLRRRARLPQYSTFDDALDLIRSSKRIIVLTGAGISVSCGIPGTSVSARDLAASLRRDPLPDFRSPTGLYAMLKQEGKYDLDDPQQM